MREPAAHVDLDAVAEAVRGALPDDRKSFALHEPCFGALEQRRVEACLATGWVSTAGPSVEEFERELARAAGVEHAVATNSGTAALHVALLLAGVLPGDEVLVPAISFVATANAASYCAATPHFADVDAATLCLDAAALDEHLERSAELRGGSCVNRATGRRIAALVAVHALGHPADLAPLRALAARWRLALVQDGAAALGSSYHGRPVFDGAELAIVSFNGNKILTTGGGGAVLTCDGAHAARARHLVRTARSAARWRIAHDAVGFNYAMPSLNAALGVAQLARLEELVALKRRLAQTYAAALGGLEGVGFRFEASHARSNYWLCAIALERGGLLEPLLERLLERGVHARPLWQPLHTLPMYRAAPRAAVPRSEDLAERVLCLPSSPFLAAGAAPCAP